MNYSKINYVCFWSILLMLTMAPVAMAVIGDCNSDGVTDMDDIMYLNNYLFYSGPQPNLNDCDCDGFPGVSMGDLWQLRGFLIGGSVYPSIGTDVPVPTDASFMVLGEPNGITETSASIIVKTPVPIDEAIIAYSFAPGPGEADMICTSVDFTGSVGIELYAFIYNDDHTVVIYSTASTVPTLPVIQDWSLFATVNFSVVTIGTPVTLTPISTPTVFPMLLAQREYDGTDGVRVLTPTFLPNTLIGDVNCSGSVDIDDVVYLVNWIFNSGPPPGDPNNDGIPDC